jgi:hypothetical protein
MAVPATWKCSSCGTMNSRRSGPCMACGAAEATASAKPSPDGEVPTITVTIAPPPMSGAPAAGKLIAGEPSPVRSGMPATRATPSRAFASPASASAGTGPATTPGATGPLTAPSAAPLLAASSAAPATSAWRGTTSTAATPTRTPRVRPVSSTRGARKFAVGKLLGVGHIALWVYTFYSFLWHPAWGQSLLAWARHVAVSTGGPVSASTADSWRANRVVSDSASWIGHLPWGASTNAYFVLAIACLLVRLNRRLPGWLSLAVTLPAAVYGLLQAVSYFPALAFYWPTTAMALVVAWIVVAKTIRRY